jgi:subtilisin family serine protease
LAATAFAPFALANDAFDRRQSERERRDIAASATTGGSAGGRSHSADGNAASPDGGAPLSKWIDEIEKFADAGPEYVPHELLVKPAASAVPAARDAARRAVSATVIRAYPLIGVERWRLGAGVSVEQALQTLSAPALRGAIEYAEPNYIVHAHGFPNDPRRADLWGLHNAGQTGGTLDADIDAPEAWELQTGSAGVVVGIIDSGIDYNHEDLAANIWTNANETINGVDDDGNGYVDDIRGWDFVSNDNDPMDDNSHGSHTAGTVGAVGNNGVGVAGVCWNVKLMPLKFLNAGGSGSTADAIEAVQYAAWFKSGGQNVVRITNNSWGGGNQSKSLKDAINASGSLFVASAGNSGSSGKQYPAAYDLANVISVAATDHADGLASFSNYGTSWVDLGAPGVGTLSTEPGDSYGLKSGTSMSAPHVSGAAALVMAQFPGYTNQQVKDQILNSVDPLAALQGRVLTGGRLNVRAAVGAGELPPDTTPPDPITDLAGAPDPDEAGAVMLTWTATGDDGAVGAAYAYDIRYTGPSLNYTPQNPLSVFDGLDQSGDWTITVKDAAANMEGTLEGWSLRITTAAGTNEYGVSDLGLAIPDGGSSSVSHAFSVPDSGAILDVDVSLEITHTWIGDLIVTIAHGGTSVVIVDRPGEPASQYGCGGDNFAGAYLDDEGTGGAIETTCSTNLTSIGLAGGEPPPQPAGAAEVATVEGLTMGETYTFTLNVLDEAGNAAAATNDVTITLPFGAYDVQIVDNDGSVGGYRSLVFAPDGYPAIAYSDATNDRVKFAKWNGTSWDKEVVGNGQPGISLAYSPAGAPSISWANGGKLYFASKSGSSWATTEIERRNVQADYTSLAYDGAGNPAISYRDTRNGLKVARRIGGSWQITVVDSSAAARYNSLAIDPDNGYPAIAYSHDADGNNSLDTLKFARFTGSAWQIETVETGTTGMGVFATLAYDPTTGNPAISTFAYQVAGRPVRFHRWNGAAWELELLYDDDGADGPALTFGADGTAYIGYVKWEETGSFIKWEQLAARDPLSGTWTVETVETGRNFSRPSPQVSPGGVPSVAYRHSPSGSNVLKFAQKAP